MIRTSFTGALSAQDPTLSDNSSWDANNGTCTPGTTRPAAHALQSRPARFLAIIPRAVAPAREPARFRAARRRAAARRAVARYRATRPQSTCTAAGTCSISGHTTQSSCTSAGICSKSQYTTSSTCASHNGTWTLGKWTTGVWTAGGTWTAGVWTPATWTPNNHNTWNGCVMDRGISRSTPDTANNYDTNVLTRRTPSIIVIAISRPSNTAPARRP